MNMITLWIRVIPTAQSESILLSTSEEEQPEDDSKATKIKAKVGIRLENSWNFFGPCPFQNPLMEKKHVILLKMQRKNTLKACRLVILTCD